MQALQGLQALQVSQPDIRDLRAGEVQVLEVRQPSDNRELLVRDIRAPQVQADQSVEVPESSQVFPRERQPGEVELTLPPDELAVDVVDLLPPPGGFLLRGDPGGLVLLHGEERSDGSHHEYGEHGKDQHPKRHEARLSFDR